MRATRRLPLPVLRGRVCVGATAVLAALLAAGVVVLGAAPASAHADRERAERLRAEHSSGAVSAVPLVLSPRVHLVDSVPGSAGISGCFLKTAPLFVTSNLDSVKVYDVRKPARPEDGLVRRTPGRCDAGSRWLPETRRRGAARAGAAAGGAASPSRGQCPAAPSPARRGSRNATARLSA